MSGPFEDESSLDSIVSTVRLKKIIVRDQTKAKNCTLVDPIENTFEPSFSLVVASLGFLLKQNRGEDLLDINELLC